MSCDSHRHLIFYTDATSWYHIDVSFIIGEKIARKKVKSNFPNIGQPGYFKEIVQHWVAFDMVQIFIIGMDLSQHLTSHRASGQKT